MFELPIQTMYGGFDYNNLIPGLQWTALWYHDQKLICYETQPWDGGTGGIGGYTECSNPIGGWVPGEYEVQIFMGYDWKVVGRFRVIESPCHTYGYTDLYANSHSYSLNTFTTEHTESTEEILKNLCVLRDFCGKRFGFFKEPTP